MSSAFASTVHHRASSFSFDSTDIIKNSESANANPVAPKCTICNIAKTLFAGLIVGSAVFGISLLAGATLLMGGIAASVAIMITIIIAGMLINRSRPLPAGIFLKQPTTSTIRKFEKAYNKAQHNALLQAKQDKLNQNSKADEEFSEYADSPKLERLKNKLTDSAKEYKNFAVLRKTQLKELIKQEKPGLRRDKYLLEIAALGRDIGLVKDRNTIPPTINHKEIIRELLKKEHLIMSDKDIQQAEDPELINQLSRLPFPRYTIPSILEKLPDNSTELTDYMQLLEQEQKSLEEIINSGKSKPFNIDIQRPYLQLYNVLNEIDNTNELIARV